MSETPKPRWFQEWPCVCNRGDGIFHKHYEDGSHRCGRCVECQGHQPDIPEKIGIRMLLGPVMTVDEAAAILFGKVQPLSAPPSAEPTTSPYIAPDPEPDLPEHECTTADMLRKVAKHIKDGNLVVANGLDADEWADALNDRAGRLEQRARRAAQPSAAPNDALAERIVDSLFADEESFANATHGNYDADTFRVRIRDRWIADVERALRASSLSETPAGQTDWISKVIREVAELPDRTSPDDWPDAMLVTADELRRILQGVSTSFPASSVEQTTEEPSAPPAGVKRS